jgi:hypothetical protein
MKRDRDILRNKENKTVSRKAKGKKKERKNLNVERKEERRGSETERRIKKD